MHLAEEDEFIPAQARQAIVDSVSGLPNVEVHTYAGCHHAFARHNGAHYDRSSAERANTRTVAFLKAHLLQGQGPIELGLAGFPAQVDKTHGTRLSWTLLPLEILCDPNQINQPSCYDLTNPVWRSLSGEHVTLAQANRGALRYQPSVAPFGALELQSRACVESLAQLVEPGEEVCLVDQEANASDLFEAVLPFGGYTNGLCLNCNSPGFACR